MGKVMDELKKQEEIEGLTDDLKIVYKIYNTVLATSRSNNDFNTLVTVGFHQWGKSFMDSYKFRYASPLALALMDLGRKDD